MIQLDHALLINKKPVKNRILMPPIVCFNWANDMGFETVDRSKHYGARAKGGVGTIVIEATAITKDGRLADTQLGLWEDDHIPQFERIAKACHDHKTLALVQLVHAGAKSVGETVYSSSAVDLKDKSCFAMNEQQIETVIELFVRAAIRAKQAGLDGVEIHGAHGYLLNQFASAVTNTREDAYGGHLDGRLALSLRVVKAVREATGEDFIIGYRLGLNDPTFKEDIVAAKKLEEAGVDLLNVSAGIGVGEPQVPEDFEFSPITYMGVSIKPHVNIPVASVFGILYPEQAKKLIENNQTDLVAVGRAILADPEWSNKALANKEVNVCYHCKPRCKFAVDGHTCPWLVGQHHGE
jgi:NADPH2 dehydrogenase